MAGMNGRQGNATILLADDDRSLRGATAQMLSEAGYVCAEASNGSQALEKFANVKPDLVILDIMMPGLDGFEVCERIRQVDGMVPVLFFSAKGDIVDKRIGYKLGADDYLVKPFSPREVVSRIKAVLRRTCAAPDTAQDEKLTTLTYGSLEIQPERYSVKLAGQSVACTPREVELLYLLASHPGRVFDREQILSRIWGYDFFGDTRTVDTHIKRLRQKLTCEEMGQKWDIITVYGVGYKFEAET